MKPHLLLYIALAAIMTGCTGSSKSDGGTGISRKPQPSDSLYTLQAAMSIYAYQPVRALQIVDSAVIVGNISEVMADRLRARVYSMTLMKDQMDSLLGGPKDVRLDTALAIGERLLRHDSIKAHLNSQKDVLEVLVHTERMQNDTLGWLQRSQQFVEVCRKLGPEAATDALRTEAEIGAALHSLGQHEQGMAKLDSVIDVLSEKRRIKSDKCATDQDNSFVFSELDALIIALKRKIVLFGAHNQFAETVPLARKIIDCLDDYEAHPEDYHDGTTREPKNAQKRDDYIRFYRSQAQNFISAAYVSLGENSNMLESFNQMEASVRDATIREHIASYNALEHQMQRQAAESHSRQMYMIAIATTAALLFTMLFAFYVSAKNRIINKKNQGLVKLIDENIKLKTHAQPQPMKEGGTSSLFTRLSTDIREQQLYLDPSFDRQAVCDRFHLSPVQVGNAFAQGSDYNSVADFIRDCRLEHACLLLKTTDMTIASVATSSGFSRVTTFNHDFKTRYNLSPSEYRLQ